MNIRTIALLWIWSSILSSPLVAQEIPVEVSNLPVEVLKAEGKKNILIVYITGDGGWNKFSQELGNEFVKRGYSVVALNSRKYFWDAKTPEIFAADLDKIISYYLAALHKTTCIIVGYSFGADVVAFLPTHLPEKSAKKNILLALLSPSASTDFVIRVSELISFKDSSAKKYKVAPEIKKTRVRTLCLFGADEDLILKKELNSGDLLKVEELPGSHRYNEGASALVERIIEQIKTP